MRASLTAAATTAVVTLLLNGPAASANDFGSPPSGEVPIIYNDHTVYAKPDRLVRSRVLAALVKDGQIYVPLRSMFEAMGASVSVSANGRTVSADKPGSSVSVTLGKDEVVVNGESRPLDVPPMLYRGVLLVPVRVLSEAMGAYVQWVPSRRVVVVRYIPVVVPSPPPPPPPIATARPTTAPTAAPTARPTAPPPAATAAPIYVPPAPTPEPTQRPYSAFVTAAYSAPNNYNEFVAGGYCDTYLLSAVITPQGTGFAFKADFRQDNYVTSNNTSDAFGNRYTQFATIDRGVAFTPVFMGRQNSLDVRAEYGIASQRIYVGVGYIHTTNNFGYPNLNGLGVGIEKLPDLRPGLSFYGSAFYYPNVSGTYTVSNPASPNNGVSYRQQYQIMKYDVGMALVFAHSPVFVHGGFAADQYTVRQNAPVGQLHAGPYIGLGVKI
jgi:hypothetical protein